jgi:hypothetical protein
MRSAVLYEKREEKRGKLVVSLDMLTTTKT